MFRVLALHQSGGEVLTLETSAFYSLQWLIYVFNSVVKLNTKLPAILSRRCSTTVSLETSPFIHLSFYGLM